MKKYLLIIPILILVSLACGRSTPRELPSLYPSQTPNATQTPIVIEITNTPENTQTPEFIYVVQTSTLPSTTRCVIATEAVYLRPTPSTDNYPVAPLPKGSKVILSGSVNGSWVFALFGEKSGWVQSNYLGNC